MHSWRAEASVDSDRIFDQVRCLVGFGGHLEWEIHRWRPSIETWLGRASLGHRRSVERLTASAPEMSGRIERAARILEALGRETADAEEELRRIAWSLEASVAALPAGSESLGAADALRRRAAAQEHEVIRRLHDLDRRTARRLDDVRHRPLETPALEVSATDERRRLIAAMTTTRIRIERHAASLAAAIEVLGSEPWEERPSSDSLALTHLTEQLALHRAFLEPGRQVIEWDPAGDGRIVEVFGDLATAAHIVVVVPGIMNAIRNFDRIHARRAKDLWRTASEIDPETAVVAWLGYDAPEVTNSMSTSRAVEHEAALRSFVGGLPSDAHISVVAHSYGTVLAGEAAARGLKVSDLVVLGSPGTRFDHVDEMKLGPGARVWAGVSDTDRLVGRSSVASVVCPETAIGAGWLTPARWIINPVTIPVSRKFGACETDGDGDVKRLSHGVNPAHEDFGAIEIDTSGVDGHSSYFAEGSTTLAETARIVTGTHPGQD